MRKKWLISRRTFLRGLGASLALPWLEIMMPSDAHAQAAAKRFIAMIFPAGVPGYGDNAWEPIGTGTSYMFRPEILEPLQSFRSQVPQISMISGLNRPSSVGSHTAACASLLTGASLNDSPTVARAGISVDQVIANSIGTTTRIPSLQMTTLITDSSGGGDMATAYFNCLSWKSPSEYIQPNDKPLQIFERLTAGINTGGNPDAAKKRFYHRRVLDAIKEDITQLKSKLGSADAIKMDEYYTSVRDLERTLTTDSGSQCTPGTAPSGSRMHHGQKMDAMIKLIKLAIQCDQTRVLSFMTACELPGTDFAFMGIPKQYYHHVCSHYRHQGVPDNLLGYLKQINRYYVTQFVALLTALKEINEGPSTALDNTLVLFGSGFRNPDNHESRNLPIILAGGKNLGHAQGRYIAEPNPTPLANLLLSIIRAYGINQNSFGNSTGAVSGLL